MKVWQTWLIIGILTGCAGNPPQLPTWDIPEATVEAVDPLALPPLPAFGQAGDRATVDRAGVIALRAYVEAAEANTTIARENAAALEDQAAAYNSLIQAGKYQAEIAAIRQELLDQARREAFIDRQVFRAVILAGLIVAL